MYSTVIRTNEMATRPCSAQIILRDHIGNGVLMSCGAHGFVSLGDGVQFSIGPTGKHRKLVIKLGADDLYAVERVRIGRDFTVVSEAFEDGIFCDMLAERVLELGDVE